MENWEEAIKALLQISNSRGEALSKDVCKKMAQLSKSYALDENTSKYSTQLLDLLTAQGSSETKSVFTEMISHLLDRLPEPGVQWLATKYAVNLEDAERKSIKAKLEALVSNVTQVTEESSLSYGCFLGALQPSGWQSAEIQAHILNAFTLLQQNHGTFDPYVKLLFPALLPAFTHIQEDRIGQNVTTLFQNLQPHPQHLAWLHSRIKDHWSEAYPSLNFTQIAETSLAAAASHVQIQHMGDLLRSLWTLVELGSLPRDPYEGKLVGLACNVWPYHREAACHVLTAATIPPERAAISRLAESVEPDDETAVKTLQKSWGHTTGMLTDADIDQVTKQVLALGLKGTEQHPDLVLQKWMESIPGEKREERVFASLDNDSIQDEYAERIWRLITAQANKYGVTLFAQIIPLLCAKSSLDRTHRAIIESSRILGDSFKSKSDKSTLSDGLLSALIKSPSLENKRGLAQWLSAVGGAAKLSALSDHNADLDADTLDVLIGAFPSNRRELEKLKKSLPSKDIE